MMAFEHIICIFHLCRHSVEIYMYLTFLFIQDKYWHIVMTGMLCSCLSIKVCLIATGYDELGRGG